MMDGMVLLVTGVFAQVTGMITPRRMHLLKLSNLICLPIGYYQISIYEDLAQNGCITISHHNTHANGIDHDFRFHMRI